MLRLLVLAALLLTPSTAQARPVPLPPTPWQVVRDQDAVAAVSSEHPGVFAYAYADVSHSRIVTTGPLENTELAHEVGHLFDWQVLTDTDRSAFAAVMHSPARGWYELQMPSGDAAEWFADYYAAAAGNYDPRTRRVRGGGIRTGDTSPYAKITYKRLQRFRLMLLGVTVRDGLKTGLIR